MEELKEGKEITYVEVEAYLKRVFLTEWGSWLFIKRGKPGLEVLQFNTQKGGQGEPTITVLVEFYPDGSNEGYSKVIFEITMEIAVELNKEGKPVKIIEEEGELNGLVKIIRVYGTRYKDVFHGEEHTHTREQDKLVRGLRKRDWHTFKTTNGSCIILYATRYLVSKNFENKKELEAYKEHNVRKVDTKEDMLRLERFYHILKADKLCQVSLEEDSIKGRYLLVNSSVFKKGLNISPNFIVEKTYTENKVYYSKYGATSNSLRNARKILAQKAGYTIKDIKANMYIDKFFRNYVIANDLRRKVKLEDKQQK